MDQEPSYQLTINPDELLCLNTRATIPRGHRDWPTEWLETHSPLPIPPPYELGSPQHYQAIRAKTWEWMTDFIKARRYDSIETCVGYYNSGVARYRAEARAMVAWRDQVNLALEALVQNPPPGLETWEQVKLLLPQPEAYAWPAAVELPLDTMPPATMHLE